jgi:hypothetical protein
MPKHVASIVINDCLVISCVDGVKKNTHDSVYKAQRDGRHQDAEWIKPSHGQSPHVVQNPRIKHISF